MQTNVGWEKALKKVMSGDAQSNIWGCSEYDIKL